MLLLNLLIVPFKCLLWFELASSGQTALFVQQIAREIEQAQVLDTA